MPTKSKPKKKAATDVVAPVTENAAPPNDRADRRDPYQFVTDTILRHLEEGVVPWRRPWSREVGKPRNFHTGKPYRGVNLLLLGLRKFASPFWLTFQQVKALGGSVRKGERGSTVVNWGQFTPKQDDTDSQAANGRRKSRFYLKEYIVFNAAQTEGIEFPPIASAAPMPKSKSVEVAEQIVANMPQPPLIMQGQRDMAAYKPSTDTVFVPPENSFASIEDYHLTLFHELVHATGHESRLNRKTLVEHDGFGGKVYSQEELVAEMGAAYLGLEADIVQDDHLNAAAYIQSWLDVLREPDHKRWIVIAASQAAKAADCVLGIKPPTIDEAKP
ncbi:MAG: ssDNA-binding domain-containing protein [Verrucomicrobiaceae bacterium]|nr:ssDNA-binding domain-containing protein [Verrucomicrobiaceae bacterium]